MLHGDTMYELARLRIADDLRQAERDRLVRQAGADRRSGAIDAVPFRDRLARLFGTAWPAARGRRLAAGA